MLRGRAPPFGDGGGVVFADQLDQPRVVDLQDQAGVDDGPVFLAEGVADGLHVLLFARVVRVVTEAPRRGRGHEGFFDVHAPGARP